MCMRQYGTGNYPPSHRGNAFDQYLCGHNVLMAHARVKALYASKYAKVQKGRIGLGLHMHWPEPITNSSGCLGFCVGSRIERKLIERRVECIDSGRAGRAVL